MIPAVPPPKRAKIARPVQLSLKPGWRYDERRALFISSSGETFMPQGLPRRSRVVYTVPSLARAARKRLSRAERDLQRYMQVIFPLSRRPEDQLEAVRAWPCVEHADVAPEISLPTAPSVRRRDLGRTG